MPTHRPSGPFTKLASFDVTLVACVGVSASNWSPRSLCDSPNRELVASRPKQDHRRGAKRPRGSQEGHLFSSCFCHQLLVTIITMMLVIDSALACGPGRGGGRRRSPRKLTPLVFKQHVPNVSENTLGASGLTEGKVARDDPRFKELVPNYNPDIIFKDEEGTGADRLMTQRLKEKLNTLAISVMNQWPGVKLRVTEGWDEEGHHASDSLHYEGRAVDITTSDRDRSKYGMLARLAVEAGFDWVYYESRVHIHCSVKSEKSDAARSGGCFDEKSLVYTRQGPLPVAQLRVGDEILALEPSGELVFSETLLFLDRDPSVHRLFYTIETESGKSITLTPSHLIFVAEENGTSFERHQSSATFAKYLTPGQFLFTSQLSGDIYSSPSPLPPPALPMVQTERIVRVESKLEKGVFAPLTREGNLVVNGIVASCYAIINDQATAHWSFLPIRVLENMKHSLKYLSESVNFVPKTRKPFSTASRTKESDLSQVKAGIHWYPSLLYSLAKYVIPSQNMY